MPTSFGQARQAYENRANLNSAHTLGAYLRAIDLLLDFLGDKHFQPRLPIQARAVPMSSDYLIDQLTQADEPIILNFAQWLQTPSDDEQDKRPYAISTVELRMAGIQRWFEFMQAENWLPESFALDHAIDMMKASLQKPVEVHEDKAVTVEHDLSVLLTYYDSQKPSKQIQNSPDRLLRWELTRLRNCALIKTLGETGGQISAILSINVATIPADNRELDIDIVGKNTHAYRIHLKDSLPAIHAYLKKRDVPASKSAKSPLFVSHDARYDGKRMSRIIAWRIVQRAAKGVGLPEVSPHDLRHWCAQQMIEQGATLEEVKERLGHRSMHTVRAYYGHMVEAD